MVRRSGGRSILMLAAMMAAAAGGRSPFMTGGYPERRRMSGEEAKKRAHRLNPVDLTEHEFVIKGETIMASSKKVAMKIYANRHPENKKKRK